MDREIKDQIKKEEPIKSTHVGCLCCPDNLQLLAMRTRLYNGFGGYHVTKDGEHYFSADPSKDIPFENNKTLSYIERRAKLEPEADWRVHLNLPLRAGVWQRHGKSKWVLIEEGEGFA